MRNQIEATQKQPTRKNNWRSLGKKQSQPYSSREIPIKFSPKVQVGKENRCKILKKCITLKNNKSLKNINELGCQKVVENAKPFEKYIQNNQGMTRKCSLNSLFRFSSSVDKKLLSTHNDLQSMLRRKQFKNCKITPIICLKQIQQYKRQFYQFKKNLIVQIYKLKNSYQKVINQIVQKYQQQITKLKYSPSTIYYAQSSDYFRQLTLKQSSNIIKQNKLTQNTKKYNNIQIDYSFRESFIFKNNTFCDECQQNKINNDEYFNQKKIKQKQSKNFGVINESKSICKKTDRAKSFEKIFQTIRNLKSQQQSQNVRQTSRINTIISSKQSSSKHRVKINQPRSISQNEHMLNYFN